MNPEERALHLGLDKLAGEIKKYGTDKNYWGLGVKRYVQMYNEQQDQKLRREQLQDDENKTQ